VNPPLHANLLAFRAAGRWRGVLLRGGSGAGKSNLSLRLCQAGLVLVADDRVIAWRSGGRLWGRAPDVLLGLIEVRGVGVLRRSALSHVEIVRVIDCAPPGAQLDRIPEEALVTIDQVSLPRLVIDASALAAATAVRAWCGVGVV
jgi:serine kinase of HPr protein (carbohydrate metabolism regulator)